MTKHKKVLIFIVAYNAESFIQQVLKRIPNTVWQNDEYRVSVLVIDDQSSDKTFLNAIEYAGQFPYQDIEVLYNPVNQGYGGNQKIGYYYAIKNGFDAVVLLHGDGQYAPEYLDQMIRHIITDQADAVLGSRMMKRLDALRGGMPLYKWVGNQILTSVQNLILRTHLSEFHTGYRSYSIKALKSIPFSSNSDYFDFDTDIIIQLLQTGHSIKEIPIPTYYGKEISYVSGLKYAFLILLTTLQSRLTTYGIFYNPKFDYDYENEHYDIKLGYPSSHQFALDHITSGMTVLDVGSGPGYMAEKLQKLGIAVVSMDKHIQPLTIKYSKRTIEAEVEDYRWTPEDTNVEIILLLDIIEHLRQPEKLLSELRETCMMTGSRPKFIITTPNIAFSPVRLGLLLGWFHYGKKGILDKNHHHLFTFSSLKRTLQQSGYDILEVRGIPAPYPLAIGDNLLSRLLLKINELMNLLSSGMFAYQIGIVAQPRPTLEYLLRLAKESSKLRMD